MSMVNAGTRKVQKRALGVPLPKLGLQEVVNCQAWVVLGTDLCSYARTVQVLNL